MGAKWRYSVHKLTKPSFLVPIEIFDNELSALESISKYLMEAEYKAKDIALSLNRSEKTIWDAFYKARSKLNSLFDIRESRLLLPLDILRYRQLGVLEAITEYLKDECNMRYCQIAPLLQRDQRTIWTVYNRAKKKRRKNA